MEEKCPARTAGNRTLLYKTYLKDAEEYNKRFTKKCDKISNTNLISVSRLSERLDPGPPNIMIQVQNISYSGLAVIIFSAFVAMRVRRHARILDRRRYSNVAMAFLPLVVRSAPLLLGRTLFRYPQTIDHGIALVISGPTWIGMSFCPSAIAAGSVCKSCPHRTLGSRVIRCIQKHLVSDICGFRLRTLRYLRQHLSLFGNTAPLFDKGIKWWEKSAIAQLAVVTFLI